MSSESGARREVAENRATPVVATERLLLRLGCLADIPAIIRYHDLNRDFFAPFAPVSPAALTPEFWREQLHRNAEDFEKKSALRVFLFEKSAPERPVGYLIFGKMFRGPFGDCSVGATISREFAGQGYMAEAMRAGIDFIFRQWGLERIQGEYQPENTFSHRLVRAIGFSFVGLIRDYVEMNGRRRDCLIVSLSKTDWVGNTQLSH